MSYNLTPIVVDISKLKSLMGSKDVTLLQRVIKKNRENMLAVDGLGEDYEDFEDDIKAEYQAFASGDFSAVDLKQAYPDSDEGDDDEDDEDDEELADLVKGLKGKGAADPEAQAKLMEKLGGMMEGFVDDDEDDDETEEDEPVGREVTTGAALVHMILGGNQDASYGYKYGYSLEILCKDAGEVPEHDSWCSIRNASFQAVDAILKKIGVEPKMFSTSEFLINRGAPVLIPKPDDFPFIGYLTRDEITKILPLLDAAKIESAIRAEDEDTREWLASAIGEMRSWLESAAKMNRDLICFYS